MGSIITAILPVLLGRVINKDPAQDAKPTRYSKTMQGAHLGAAGALGLILAQFGWHVGPEYTQEVVSAAAVILGFLRTAYGRYKAEG